MSPAFAKFRYHLDLLPREAPRLARIAWEQGGTLDVPLVSLPPVFLEWQLRARLSNVRFFLTGEGEREFTVHTGYMATLGADGAFPLNVAAKGIGLLPAKGLPELTARAEELVAKALRQGDPATRKERLEFLLELYERVPMDERVLTTIELYGKQTWRNVLRDPRCSVLFASSRGTSFDVHGVVEILPPGDTVYRYVVALHDLFHAPVGPRREFPGVYRIWCSEVWDKTPGPQAGTRLS